MKTTECISGGKEVDRRAENSCGAMDISSLEVLEEAWRSRGFSAVGGLTKLVGGIVAALLSQASV